MLLCLFFILCVPFRGAVKRNSLFISLMARWIRTFVHTMFKPHPVNTVQCSVLCLLLTCLPFLINLVALEALGQSLRFLLFAVLLCTCALWHCARSFQRSPCKTVTLKKLFHFQLRLFHFNEIKSKRYIIRNDMVSNDGGESGSHSLQPTTRDSVCISCCTDKLHHALQYCTISNLPIQQKMRPQTTETKQNEKIARLYVCIAIDKYNRMHSAGNGTSSTFPAIVLVMRIIIPNNNIKNGSTYFCRQTNGWFNLNSK